MLLIHQMLKMEDDLDEIDLHDQIQENNHHKSLYFEEQKEEENVLHPIHLRLLLLDQTLEQEKGFIFQHECMKMLDTLFV